MPNSILSTALAHPAQIRFAPDSAVIKVVKNGSSIESEVLLVAPDGDHEGPATRGEALAREIGGDLDLRIAVSPDAAIVLTGATSAMLRFCDPQRVQLACGCRQRVIVDDAIANSSPVILLVQQFVERVHPSDLARSQRDDAPAWSAWQQYLAATPCGCTPNA